MASSNPESVFLSEVSTAGKLRLSFIHYSEMQQISFVAGHYDFLTLYWEIV